MKMMMTVVTDSEETAKTKTNRVNSTSPQDSSKPYAVKSGLWQRPSPGDVNSQSRERIKSRSELVLPWQQADSSVVISIGHLSKLQ